jgi:hypothetical protein
MLMMSRSSVDQIDLRLVGLLPALCRHLCRHSLSAWWIGNSRPSSQIFPERPRGPNVQGARGQVDPCGPSGSRSLVSVSRDRKALPHKTQQAPRSWERQNVNNQTTTTNPPLSFRLPAGYLEGGSPQLPGCTPPPLTLSPETLFTGTGPVLFNTLQCGRFRPGATGLCWCHGI